MGSDAFFRLYKQPCEPNDFVHRWELLFLYIFTWWLGVLALLGATEDPGAWYNMYLQKILLSQ